MRPISSGLHYLEGDHVDASHILPVYALLHQSAQSPCGDVSDTFSQETIDAIASLFKDRWNGTGRKVGIRNNLHCLAWKLDLHARYIVTHGFSNGPELLTAIDSSFGFSAVMEAIKTYSQKNSTKYAQLVAEYEAYTSKTGIWELKHTSTEMLITTKIAKALAGMSDEIKSNPVTRLIELLKCNELTLSRKMHMSMSQDMSSPNELRLFTSMAVGKHSVFYGALSSLILRSLCLRRNYFNSHPRMCC